MKQNKLHIILWAVVALAGAGLLRAVSPEAQRKSLYFTNAAIQMQTQGNDDASHELFKRAYALDTTNLAAAYCMAMGDLSTVDEGDSVGVARVFNLMRRYADAYPGDVNENNFYASLCSAVGDLPEAIRIYKRIYSLNPQKTDLLVTLGQMYGRIGEQDSSINYFNLYEKAEGPSPMITVSKVMAYLDKADTVGAVRELDQPIERNPKDCMAVLVKGMMMPNVGREDSSLYYMKKAEEIDPRNGAVKLSLADYYQQQHDTAAYRDAVYNALLLDDIELEQKLNLLQTFIADILYDKRSTREADFLFNTLRDQYPHEPQILDFGARYSYAKEDYPAAVEQIGYAIDMDPDNSDYRMQQLSYMLTGKMFKQAISSYEALPDSLKEQSSFTYLGMSAYSSDGQYAKAIGRMEEMIRELLPEGARTDTLQQADIRLMKFRDREILSDAFTMLGDTYYQDKKLPETFRAYDNALTANPDNASTLNNYAYFLTENKGDLDRALEMSKKACEIMPGVPTFMDTLAWIYFRKADYKEALSEMLKAMEEVAPGDESAEYYEHLGDIYFMNAEPAKALENWEKALPLDPDNKLLQKKVKHKTYFYE